MENFECIGGPFDGSRMDCGPDPYEGRKVIVFSFEDDKQYENCYELRRDKVIEPITGEGSWAWHWIPLV